MSRQGGRAISYDLVDSVCFIDGGQKVKGRSVAQSLGHIPTSDPEPFPPSLLPSEGGWCTRLDTTFSNTTTCHPQPTSSGTTRPPYLGVLGC